MIFARSHILIYHLTKTWHVQNLTAFSKTTCLNFKRFAKHVAKQCGVLLTCILTAIITDVSSLSNFCCSTNRDRVRLHNLKVHEHPCIQNSVTKTGSNTSETKTSKIHEIKRYLEWGVQWLLVLFYVLGIPTASSVSSYVYEYLTFIPDSGFGVPH